MISTEYTPLTEREKVLFDLKGYVARRLARAGLTQVETLAADTCAEPARFFSYRRACLEGEACYGRLLSAISLES